MRNRLKSNISVIFISIGAALLCSTSSAAGCSASTVLSDRVYGALGYTCDLAKWANDKKEDLNSRCEDKDGNLFELSAATVSRFILKRNSKMLVDSDMSSSTAHGTCYDAGYPPVSSGETTTRVSLPEDSNAFVELKCSWSKLY
jgi:hypothetical protein